LYKTSGAGNAVDGGGVNDEDDNDYDGTNDNNDDDDYRWLWWWRYMDDCYDYIVAMSMLRRFDWKKNTAKKWDFSILAEIN